ncbi:ionotropic receptor 75a [Teleopsis dalmanni]|uniref:ionotropic receptor 75a n=1 Tax=Teleopsis dalmanni TaxID=139649 RepID=UPI0018CD48C0|nr:ionotropic receptor 75a [Teleopsis dalmanni]
MWAMHPKYFGSRTPSELVYGTNIHMPGEMFDDEDKQEPQTVFVKNKVKEDEDEIYHLKLYQLFAAIATQLLSVTTNAQFYEIAILGVLTNTNHEPAVAEGDKSREMSLPKARDSILGIEKSLVREKVPVNLATTSSANDEDVLHALLQISLALLHWNQLVYPINLHVNYSLNTILTRKNHARTSVVIDCACVRSQQLLSEASAQRYFNKTYQWLLWNTNNLDVEQLLPLELDYLGPNAQVTFINKSFFEYSIWDVHSKGRHLRSPLELQLIGVWHTDSNCPNSSLAMEKYLNIHADIFQLQSIKYRDQFKGLTLRGASVIDQDNITTNEQIERMLSRPTKDFGVAAFSKYHYELLGILRERFNFTVNFRNARGWAGRLGNTRFRLGFLGIVTRNEADVGATGAFNRINRFAEFDTIHQSWKFETAFLYRFTPNLDTHSKSGNFLAPFDDQVWIFSIATLIAVNLNWRLVDEISRNKRKTNNNQCDISCSQTATDETSLVAVSLKTFAAVCQQGIEPISGSLQARTIILTTFLFSLVMYNYYTSSVVGGLLSSTAQGPATIDEVIISPLMLSFEDIGYYKVLFRENKAPYILRLIARKLQPPRISYDIPVYAHIEDAIPYLKKGGYAFHCEVVDAYPEIAKQFDANEICDLRVVSGLMETEIMNWIVHKNSQYTEIFRIAMGRAREVGFVERLLKQRQPKKPICQALYTVYPVSITGVSSAFMMLGGGFLLSAFGIAIEKYIKKHNSNYLK